MILENKLNITDQAELAREEEKISKEYTNNLCGAFVFVFLYFLYANQNNRWQS